MTTKSKGWMSALTIIWANLFPYGEFLAHIRALMRRSQKYKEAVLKIAELELNPATHPVTRGWKRDYADQQGICAAGILPVQQGPRPFGNPHCGACLGYELRPRNQCRHRVYPSPAQQNRQRL